jgi:hypothetical protein
MIKQAKLARRSRFLRSLWRRRIAKAGSIKITPPKAFLNSKLKIASCLSVLVAKNPRNLPRNQYRSVSKKFVSIRACPVRCPLDYLIGVNSWLIFLVPWCLGGYKSIICEELQYVFVIFVQHHYFR